MGEARTRCDPRNYEAGRSLSEAFRNGLERGGAAAVPDSDHRGLRNTRGVGCGSGLFDAIEQRCPDASRTQANRKKTGRDPSLQLA
jgi:hypothetical protein